MQVFISWSGDQSKAVAELLNEWIPCVIQAIDPWISSADLDKGSMWFSDLTEQLKATRVGIVCVTKENLNRPWLLFEAGAILKGIPSNRVCTFLVDLEPSDIEPPLSQLNHTVYDKEDIYKLLKDINKRIDTGGLEEPRLRKIFENSWPEFEEGFKEILKTNAALQTQPQKPKRSPEDIMAEILDNTRQLNKSVGKLENHLDDNRWHGAHSRISDAGYLPEETLGTSALIQALEGKIQTMQDKFDEINNLKNDG